MNSGWKCKMKFWQFCGEARNHVDVNRTKHPTLCSFGDSIYPSCCINHLLFLFDYLSNAGLPLVSTVTCWCSVIFERSLARMVS